MSSHTAKDTTNIRLSIDTTAVGGRSTPNLLPHPPPALRPHHIELATSTIGFLTTTNAPTPYPYSAIDLARAVLARQERTHPSSSLRVTAIADEDTHRPDELRRTMRLRREYRQDMVLLYYDALRRMEEGREEGPVGLEEAFGELEKLRGGNVDLEDSRPIARQARYLRRLLCFWATPTYEGVGLPYLAAWQLCAGRELTPRESQMLE